MPFDHLKWCMQLCHCYAIALNLHAQWCNNHSSSDKNLGSFYLGTPYVRNIWTHSFVFTIQTATTWLPQQSQVFFSIVNLTDSIANLVEYIQVWLIYFPWYLFIHFILPSLILHNPCHFSVEQTLLQVSTSNWNWDMSSSFFIYILLLITVQGINPRYLNLVYRTSYWSWDGINLSARYLNKHGRFHSKILGQLHLQYAPYHWCQWSLLPFHSSQWSICWSIDISKLFCQCSSCLELNIKFMGKNLWEPIPVTRCPGFGRYGCQFFHLLWVFYPSLL